jgi:hypothetical protein
VLPTPEPLGHAASGPTGHASVQDLMKHSSQKKKKREDIWLQMLGDANDAIIGRSILDMIHISGDVHLSL